MTNWMCILIIALTAMIMGCERERSAPDTLQQLAETFVPSDAAEKIVAPDLPWLQISFRVRRPGLDFAFDEKRIERARAEGWTVCQAIGPQWEGYQDYAVTPRRHTRLRSYILYRSGTSLTLMGIYDSPIDELPLAQREDRPMQQGILIAKNEAERHAIEAAANLKLKCDTKTQNGGP